MIYGVAIDIDSQAQRRGRSKSPRRSKQRQADASKTTAGFASGGAGRRLAGSAPSLKGSDGGKISIELSKGRSTRSFAMRVGGTM
jgi:hypothetical protein